MSRIWYVYKITCSKNGKAYIGITHRPRYRWWTHLNQARLGSTQSILHVAMQKYGGDAFSFEIIAECASAAEANVCERAQIAQHGTFYKTKRGYNMTLGGGGLLGLERPEAYKQRMREMRKGYRIPQEALDRMRETMIAKGHMPPRSATEKAAALRRAKGVTAEHAKKTRAVLNSNRIIPVVEARRVAAIRAKAAKLWAIPEYRAGRMKRMKQYRHLSDDARMIMAIAAITKNAGVTLGDRKYSPNNHDLYYY